MSHQQQKAWRSPQTAFDQQQQIQISQGRAHSDPPVSCASQSQTTTAPPSPVFYGLQPDPLVASHGRVSTGNTVVDWSGLSFEENGRRYQGYMPEAYILPIDGEEQDRLDFQHAITDLILDGRQHMAPVVSPRYVLDIGAGTGIWCIEFAENHPESFVVGTDLSLIQAHPRTNNCMFILENSETAEWSFPSTLDYIHMRSVGPCFDDIRTVLGKSFDSMTPGGWIELQDGDWIPNSIDGSLEGTALQRWFSLVVDGGRRIGRDLLKAQQFESQLIQAGFTSVEKRIFQVPGNAWAQGSKAQRMGLFATTVFLQIIRSYHKFLAKAGLSEEDIDDLIPAVERDLLDLRIHWYIDVYFVYGRKPLPSYGKELLLPSELILPSST